MLSLDQYTHPEVTFDRNTLVQINSATLFGTVAIALSSHPGTYHETSIKFIHPDSNQLISTRWRTTWLSIINSDPGYGGRSHRTSNISNKSIEPEIEELLSAIKSKKAISLAKNHNFLHSLQDVCPEIQANLPNLVEDLTMELSTGLYPKPVEPLVVAPQQLLKQSSKKQDVPELYGSTFECLECLTSLPESEPVQLPDENYVSPLPNSSNGIISANKSSEKTSLKSPNTEISPPITPEETRDLGKKDSPPNSLMSLTLSGLPHHAPPLASPDDKEEVMMNAIASPTPSELSTNVNQDGSLLKTSPDCLDVPDDQETIEEPILTGSLTNYGSEVIQASGAFSQVPNLDCHTSAKDCLSLPTPTGLSSHKSRPPGQTKLEATLKKRGMIAPGQVANPQFLEAMFGLPIDYTLPSESIVEMQSIDLDEKRSATASQFLAPEQSLNGSSISMLSYDEERDRAHLEKKVERAFYEAGSALKELRDKRLYRSTHKTFEEYCKDRFGFTRQMASLKILAVDVVDNLSTNGCQILPTSERQVRAIATFPSEERTQIWNEAVEKSNGKVPSGATVKGIVERIKEKNFVPYTETSEYFIGDVVLIKASGNSSLRYLDGYWGIIERISSFAYHVCISVKKEVVNCKGYEMKRVEIGEKDRLDFKLVSGRIKKLAMRDDLETTVRAVIEAMQRKIYFSPVDMMMLEKAEEIYSEVDRKAVINDTIEV